MGLLAFGKTYVKLGATFAPVQREWDEGVAFALDQTDEPVQLASMHEQFACAKWVGTNVGRGGGERGDGAAEQIGFGFAHRDIAFRELNTAFAQAFDLPPFEHEPRFEAFFDMEFMLGFAIQRDGAAAAAGFFMGFARFSHARIVGVWLRIACFCLDFF